MKLWLGVENDNLKCVTKFNYFAKRIKITFSFIAFSLIRFDYERILMFILQLINKIRQNNILEIIIKTDQIYSSLNKGKILAELNY